MRAKPVFRAAFLSLIAPLAAGATPLSDAVKSCQADNVASLLPTAGGDVNLPDQYGFTPAMWAVSRCNAGLLASLVKAGAAVPADTPQFSAVIEAAKNGHDDIVSYLLARQANVNARDETGKTALMWAATRLSTAKLLIGGGADPNLKDAHGQTALIMAAQHGSVAVINLLVSQPKIRLNQQDKFGYTALTWAARNGQTAAVAALTAAGADRTVQSKDGSKAADVAARRGHQDAAQAAQ